MTKTQIKYALQRGLGRGILAVRESPERYRDLVLWACGRNLSFDTQCEGTRAWYDYQLTSCYSDRAEFRDTVVRRLNRRRPDWSWDYAHFSEMLMYFAKDGDQIAEAALWDKYQWLLRRLKGFKRNSRSTRWTLDCFETICIALSWNENNHEQIASDIGSLFLNSSLYDQWDFASLFWDMGRGVITKLRSKARTSRELSAFFVPFDQMKQAEQQMKKKAADRSKCEVPSGGRKLSIYLRRTAPELAPSYAEKYLSATDPIARAEALGAFCVCPYPLDVAPVLSDAESAVPELRTAALEALAEIRDPRVRSFAWEHMEESQEEMLPIAIKNYADEDEGFLREFLSGLQVDYDDNSGWHGWHWYILDLFDRNSGVEKPPKTFLPIMYETTLCSSCRDWIVHLMGKYRMISEEMWEELRYDSNASIRKSAEAHFHRSRRKSE